ncbi:hypothetical protein GGR56DRAFT_501167 [Xylariaceae sp. FL0804]|nr:hypothetical protein GGR56DRAFT_501167 [Xylariaceae sp. FL0804]
MTTRLGPSICTAEEVGNIRCEECSRPRTRRAPGRTGPFSVSIMSDLESCVPRYRLHLRLLESSASRLRARFGQLQLKAAVSGTVVINCSPSPHAAMIKPASPRYFAGSATYSTTYSPPRQHPFPSKTGIRAVSPPHQPKLRHPGTAVLVHTVNIDLCLLPTMGIPSSQQLLFSAIPLEAVSCCCFSCPSHLSSLSLLLFFSSP